MAEVTQAAQHGLLRNRGFMALWAAQILSQTAANAVTSALIVLVAELTHNNTSSSFPASTARANCSIDSFRRSSGTLP